MVDFLVTCDCGHRMRVSEYAMGMTGRCPRCGKALTATEADSEPLEPTRPNAASPTSTPTEPEPKADDHHCARCGRIFRGTWDKYPDDRGALCHVCANLATDAPPSPPPPAPVRQAPSGAAWRHLADSPGKPTEGGPRRRAPGSTFRERHPKLVQRAVLAAGLAVVALAVFYSFTGESRLEHLPTEGGRPAASVELPPFWAYLVWGVGALFNVAGYGLAIYWVLHLHNKLPNYTLGKNILAVGIAATGLWALRAAVVWIPCAGPLLYWLLLYFILQSTFNVTLTEFLLLFVLFMITGGLMWAMKMLLFGLIAAVVL